MIFNLKSVAVQNYSLNWYSFSSVNCKGFLSLKTVRDTSFCKDLISASGFESILVQELCNTFLLLSTKLW